MEKQLIYSKFCKITKGSDLKSGRVSCSDNYLNDFVDKDVFVEVFLIKKPVI